MQIERFLVEGKSYVDKRDPVQASEKLYKVVEECIKFLAEKYNLPEYQQARREGSWWSRLLARAARELAWKFNQERIVDVWRRAFELHRFGFHENTLTTEDIKKELPHIEWLLSFMKESGQI